MKNIKAKLAASATVILLGGLGGLALSQGGKAPSKPVADKPIVHTKVIRRTVHVTKHAKPKHPIAAAPVEPASASAVTGSSGGGESAPVTTGSSGGSSESAPVTTGSSSTGSESAPVTTGASGTGSESASVTTGSSGGGGEVESESEGGGGGGDD